MIQTKTKTIGDSVFHVTTFPAIKGLEMKYRLFELLGPTLEALKVEFGDLMETKITPAIIGQVISGLTRKLKPTEFTALVLDLLSKTVVIPESDSQAIPLNGKTFDTVFADNYDALYELLAFVLEVNYKSFFDKARIGLATLGENIAPKVMPSID